MASTDARPVPKKNVAYRHYFAIRDNTGALVTSWTGQDSELSLDGGAFADATNEATEIGSSGCGYIDLTSGEMNYDAVVLKVTVTNTDALDYVVVLFPEEAGDIRTDITQLGGASQSAVDLKDFVDTGYDPTTHKVQGVVTVDTTSANSDMRGTDGAYTGTPPTASAIVDEWESQSLLDPTGFRVNVMEVNGEAQTANDNGADINSILEDTNELQGNQGDWATATSVTVSDKTGFKLASDGVDLISAGSGTIKDIIDDTANIDSIVGDGVFGNEALKTLIDAAQGDITTALGNQSDIIDDIAGLNNISTDDLDSALSSIQLDHLMATPVPGDLGEIVASGTVLSKMLSKTDDADTFVYGDDSLEAIRDAQTDASPATHLAASVNKTTGEDTPTGDNESTWTVNSTYYAINPAGVADVNGFGLDIDFTFSVGTGTSRVPSSVNIVGYVDSHQLRPANVWAYNYTTSSYDQLSSAANRMEDDTSNSNYQYPLNANHVKTTDGETKIRFTMTSTTVGDELFLDYIGVNSVAVEAAGLTANAIANAVYNEFSYVNYAGCISIDTNDGTDGTTVGVNGTPTNPVDTYADAYTLATALGIKKFCLAHGSSIQLNNSHEKWQFEGLGSIDLNSQSIANTAFYHTGTITGVSSGDSVRFNDCVLDDLTVGKCKALNCFLKGDITLTASKDCNFANCCDAESDTDTNASFVFAGNNEIGLRNYSGAIELKSMASTDTITINGSGRIIINANCTGGTINIRGFFLVVDNVDGGFTGTINDDSRYELAQIRSALGMASADLDTQIDGINSNIDDVDTSVGNLNDLDASDISDSLLSYGTAKTTDITSAHETTDALFDDISVSVSADDIHTALDSYSNKDDYKADVTNLDQKISTTESNIRGADSDTLKTLSDALDTIEGASGSGDTTVNYYVYTDEDEQTGPIADCKVWVTSDAAGDTLVASGYTNDAGKVTFYLDDGTTYYFWRSKAGYNFTNPDTETISA